MILSPNPVPATQMTWIPNQQQFVTEMSQIRGFGRVYDDACDEGLTLVSRYSDRPEIVFAVEHVERDNDGDTLYWDLKPASLADRNRVRFSVRVYND